MQGQLPISENVYNTTKNAMVLPQLKSFSLILLGQLYDNDCQVLLTKHKLYAAEYKELNLKGVRNPNNGIWNITMYKQI